MILRRCFYALLAVCTLAVALVTLLTGSSGAQRRAQTPVARSAVSGPIVVGLSQGASGYGGASTAPRLNLLIAGTGTRWLREEFLWSRIEPRPGKFNFRYYDHYMLLAAQRRVQIVLLLDNAPRWAAPTPETMPTNTASFARFVAAVAHRYGTNGTFWKKHPTLAGSAIQYYEIWNEPYFNQGSGGLWQPGLYTRLVKAAAIATHALDPTARLLIEAEMQAHLNGIWTWWVNDLYKAMPSLNRYFYAVAVHDYGTNVRTAPQVTPGKAYDGYGHILRIDNIHQQFINHAAANKPFWIMEIGWSTCTQASIDCVNAKTQATNLITAFNYLHTIWKNWVQGIFIYCYQDEPDYHTVQGAYGLTHFNGAPKPALSVFKSAVAGAT